MRHETGYVALTQYRMRWQIGDGSVRKESLARYAAAEGEGDFLQAHECANIEAEEDQSLCFHSLRESRSRADRNGHNAKWVCERSVSKDKKI